MATDAAGNLYIADQSNQRVRKVDTNGIISTVAGNGITIYYSSIGVGTYSGDGGSATNAGLDWPKGVVLDASGNLFIGDYYNNRIRKVDTGGIISTVAGGGSGGDGGAAPNAALNAPFGVALDPIGNLYIADTGEDRVREVHFAGYPTWLLNNVGTNDAGNYTVIIASPYGSVTSAVAVLTIVLPPSIIVQPASQGVMPGNNATLSVLAGEYPPTQLLVVL